MNTIKTIIRELINEIRYLSFGYYRYGLMLCQQGQVVPWFGTTFQGAIHDDFGLGATTFTRLEAGCYFVEFENAIDQSKYRVILQSQNPRVSITESDGSYLIQTQDNSGQLSDNQFWYTYIELRIYPIQ